MLFEKFYFCSWRVWRYHEHQFWIQFHPDGLRLFCVTKPSECKSAVGKSFSEFDQTWKNNETFYDFQIGPTNLLYTSNSYQASALNGAVLQNIWFIDEAFDVVMFAGNLFFANNSSFAYYNHHRPTYNDLNVFLDIAY